MGIRVEKREKRSREIFYCTWGKKYDLGKRGGNIYPCVYLRQHDVSVLELVVRVLVTVVDILAGHSPENMK